MHFIFSQRHPLTFGVLNLNALGFWRSTSIRWCALGFKFKNVHTSLFNQSIRSAFESHLCQASIFVDCVNDSTNISVNSCFKKNVNRYQCPELRPTDRLHCAQYSRLFVCILAKSKSHRVPQSIRIFFGSRGPGVERYDCNKVVSILHLEVFAFRSAVELVALGGLSVEQQRF